MLEFMELYNFDEVQPQACLSLSNIKWSCGHACLGREGRRRRQAWVGAVICLQACECTKPGHLAQVHALAHKLGTRADHQFNHSPTPMLLAR